MALENPIKSESLTELVLKLLDGVVTVLIPFIVLALVFVGVQLVFAKSGDKIKEKQILLVQLLIGAFIIFSAKGILLVVQNTTQSFIEDTSRAAETQILL